MSGAASYPTTVAFAPVIPDSGTVTGTLTVTDSAGNSGVATASGVALALKPQTITLTNPTTATETVTYGVAPIVLGATGGASGNAVTFSLVSGPGNPWRRWRYADDYRRGHGHGQPKPGGQHQLFGGATGCDNHYGCPGIANHHLCSHFAGDV